jgi:hypothetical protein
MRTFYFVDEKHDSVVVCEIMRREDDNVTYGANAEHIKRINFPFSYTHTTPSVIVHEQTSQFFFDNWSVSQISSGTSQANVIKRKNFQRGAKSAIVVTLQYTPSVHVPIEPSAVANLTSLDELIAKYTSTSQAKAFWDKVKKELQQ